MTDQNKKQYYEAEVVHDSAPQMNSKPKLHRPKEGRVIAGVCRGLADRFGLPTWLLRLVFIGLLILPPAAIVPYILFWILIPSE